MLINKLNKFAARIIINDTANDGIYDKGFILKLLKMGAEITVHCEDLNLYLEQEEDLKIFRGLKN